MAWIALKAWSMKAKRVGRSRAGLGNEGVFPEMHVLENVLEPCKQSGINSYQDAVPGGANAFPAKNSGPVSGNRKGILLP